jgi:hypothetical protein
MRTWTTSCARIATGGTCCPKRSRAPWRTSCAHAHTQSNVVGEHEGKSLSQLTDCIKCHQGGSGGGD